MKISPSVARASSCTMVSVLTCDRSFSVCVRGHPRSCAASTVHSGGRFVMREVLGQHLPLAKIGARGLRFNIAGWSSNQMKAFARADFGVDYYNELLEVCACWRVWRVPRFVFYLFALLSSVSFDCILVLSSLLFQIRLWKQPLRPVRCGSLLWSLGRHKSHSLAPPRRV